MFISKSFLICYELMTENFGEFIKVLIVRKTYALVYSRNRL
jgi:hypothetical protein